MILCRFLLPFEISDFSEDPVISFILPLHTILHLQNQSKYITSTGNRRIHSRRRWRFRERRGWSLLSISLGSCRWRRQSGLCWGDCRHRRGSVLQWWSHVTLWNDFEQRIFFMNEAPIAPRWAPNCFGQKSHKDNVTKLYVNGVWCLVSYESKGSLLWWICKDTTIYTRKKPLINVWSPA